MTHAGHSTYPVDLAAELRVRWLAMGHPQAELHEPPQLVDLLDTAYQASLLREEGEPVRCRLLVGSPEEIEQAAANGSQGMFVLRFTEPLEFTPHEVRKLAAAAGFYRSMLGVQLDPHRQAHIWGIVGTGTRWVNRVEGGRFFGAPLPPKLVVQALGPGHLIVACGYDRVLETAAGHLLTEGFDPFHSQWLHNKFESVRSALISEIDRQSQTTIPIQVCDSFVKRMAQSVVRRMLSLIRTRGHGGMLVYLPKEALDSEIIDNWFRFRVTFNQDDSTMRFRNLMCKLIRRVREIGVEQGLEKIEWEHYQQMQDSQLSSLDEAFIELAHFMADLMSVDGALVLDHSFRVIGFGGEILGTSHVTHIHRALDLEAYQTVREPAASSGTRHRSAYRLASGQKDALVVVISQDGAIRFVSHHNDKLTYWPYLP
ncbi:MAG: putative sensor domain DACNV-containing protein [Rubinisphaera brasiliensis]|uniref:putative sensor domain DACNV-containing protein n=1 Tax=Rubinisphaera TaxID=1649490 RepID=UPI000C3A408A|nr:diadenylate cyclase [Rubinisphaera sp. JC750]MBB01780.1 hypothetical protein [Planctomyces sp.]